LFAEWSRHRTKRHNPSKKHSFFKNRRIVALDDLPIVPIRIQIRNASIRINNASIRRAGSPEGIFELRG